MRYHSRDGFGPNQRRKASQSLEGSQRDAGGQKSRRWLLRIREEALCGCRALGI